MNNGDLDRYITGNWGEDSVGPDVPEGVYCPACIEGDHSLNCTVCGGTGIDPVKMAEFHAQAKIEADAEYEAYASGLKDFDVPDYDDDRVL